MTDDELNDTIHESVDQSIYIEIDWQQYYEDFCEAHGKYPILHNSRLLFPDGWTYSIDDYAGPEWPPPDNPVELARLRLIYYQRRLDIVQEELRNMTTILHNIEDLQRVKSVQLKQTIATFDEATNNIKSETVPISTVLVKKRIEWLSKDVDNCKSTINSLSSIINPLTIS